LYKSVASWKLSLITSVGCASWFQMYMHLGAGSRTK